jgi:A/G-specific adenine glycosylase
MSNKTMYFWDKMFEFYESYGRFFPWRNTIDPYHVFIAEFLLQQTHVRKVEEVFYEIIKKYPTINDLSNAKIGDLRHAIKPIGLLYRAERILNCSLIISRQYGSIPNTINKLKTLPGVGDYISKAILCYGFNQSTVPIDTNVIRIFCRFFGLSSKKRRPHTDQELANLIADKYETIVDFKTANLAILDFGGLICLSKGPKCNVCSLQLHCKYYEEFIANKE